MNVGADSIGLMKTNTKGFCKDISKNMTKYWTGGSYLVFKINTMVPGDRPLISIDYKYNSLKVLYLIATEGAGGTTSGIPNLSK